LARARLVASPAAGAAGVSAGFSWPAGETVWADGAGAFGVLAAICVGALFAFSTSSMAACSLDACLFSLSCKRWLSACSSPCLPFLTHAHSWPASLSPLFRDFPMTGSSSTTRTFIVAAPHRLGGSAKVGSFARWGGGKLGFIPRSSVAHNGGRVPTVDSMRKARPASKESLLTRCHLPKRFGMGRLQDVSCYFFSYPGHLLRDPQIMTCLFVTLLQVERDDEVLRQPQRQCRQRLANR